MAGVGLVIRAKRAPAGRLTRDTDRAAKAPGRCSTRRRRVRSGFTHAGMESLRVWGRAEEGAMIGLVEDMGVVFFPLEVGGAGFTMADGGILKVSRLSV